MANLKQRYAFPRVTTRGYYDQRTGLTNNVNPFSLYPKYKFNKLAKSEEIVVFVHGMRNTRYGAIKGARLLRNKLRKLGYKHPVIAYSYDAEVRGAHISRRYDKTMYIAMEIAKKNGQYNLTKFLWRLRAVNPAIKIRLVGHSLGCDVINHIHCPVESVHLFGSPVESDDVLYLTQYANKVVNYYNPTDDVIIEGVNRGACKLPSCLVKVRGKGVVTKTLKAKDHRFKSYISEVKKFP